MIDNFILVLGVPHKCIQIHCEIITRVSLVTLHHHTKLDFRIYSLQFSSVQLLSCVQLFVTPWTAARQASLSFTISWSLLKSMSIESVMPSNRLILCHPLLLPSIFLSIRVFSNESVPRIRRPKYYWRPKYWRRKLILLATFKYALKYYWL